MSSPQFSPGPWQTNCSHIYTPDGAIIAQVHNPGSKASDYPLVANRDLMAASPGLYVMLEIAARTLEIINETLADHGSGPSERAQEVIDCSRQILAKARGEEVQS